MKKLKVKTTEAKQTIKTYKANHIEVELRIGEKGEVIAWVQKRLYSLSVPLVHLNKTELLELRGLLNSITEVK